MKKRNLWAVAGLIIITLGIYIFYWLYMTRLDIVRRLQNKQAIPRVTWLFIPFLVLISSTVLSFIVQYFNGGTLPTAMGVVLTLTAIPSVVAIVVLPFWWFYKYSIAMHAALQRTDGMGLYILWLVSGFVLCGVPIWMFVIQNDINKALRPPQQQPDSPTPPSAPTPTPLTPQTM
jgi:hypothetical protein